MEYTEYGIVWEDGIERCSDNPNETEEEQDDEDIYPDWDEYKECYLPQIEGYEDPLDLYE